MTTKLTNLSGICPTLSPGSTIGLAATARWVDEEQLQIGESMLKEAGFKVIRATNLFSKYGQLAGNGKEKAEAFNALLNIPEVEAIWCVRGGYGSVQMVDLVDWELWKSTKKWLLGYSDVTVLHAQANKLGIPSVHSEMLMTFEKQLDKRLVRTGALASIELLKGNQQDSEASAHPYNRAGVADGELVGGNLSVLYSIMGSVSEPDYSGKILFLEDLDEYVYHIDRMLRGMKRAGKFEQLAGVVIGGMTDMKDHVVVFGKQAEEIIAEIFEEYDYPLAFNFSTGHIPENMPLILGVKHRLEVHSSVFCIKKAVIRGGDSLKKEE